jgi:hypothetical protein
MTGASLDAIQFPSLCHELEKLWNGCAELLMRSDMPKTGFSTAVGLLAVGLMLGTEALAG